MINKLYKNCVNFIKENYKYLLFLLLLFIVLTIKLPWSSYTPGGVIDINKRLTGKIYEQDGKLNMTYVTFIRGTVPSILISLIHPEWDIVSNEDITLEGEDLKIANIRDKISMEESISNATYVAYKNAGIDLDILSSKTYVMYLLKGNDSNLKVGDQIIEYDNNKLTNYQDMQKYVSEKNIGDTVNFKVLRNGKKVNAKAKIVEIDSKPLIGISLANINEYGEDIVKYKTKSSESGASGGLMLSLAIYNSITKGDITKGKNISGTGTIDDEGNVGEISGIKYKLAGAVKNKNDIFLVPTSNYEEALAVKKKYNYDIKIIEAKTFDQVLEELKNA